MPNRVGPNLDYPRQEHSEALWARAEGLIPAGTQTLAKGPTQFVRGVAPKYLQRGRGARVWDVDGNEYLDLAMGVGPLVLGYADAGVDAAIRRQLEDGITFSLMHPLEVEVAEQLRSMLPGAESIRFGKTGAEATSAAIRLARAFTGREQVICCGYHGWHDWYIGVTDRSLGVPEAVQDLTWTFSYNDRASLDDALDERVAAVILEPVVFEEPRDGFLAYLRERCTENGTVLVFDEMWTGFRLAPGGAQERYGVIADLTTYSKAVANGMPLSVLSGRADIMALLEHDVFFFSTFGGEALSLAAAQATLRAIVDRRVPERLALAGERIRTGFNRHAVAHGLDGLMSCVGPACRTLVSIAPAVRAPLELKSLAQQELLKRGILWSGTHTVCEALTDGDIGWLLASWDEVLGTLAEALDDGVVAARLRGAAVEPVFRRTGHFNTRPRVV